MNKTRSLSRSSPLNLTKASHQIITSSGHTQWFALVVKKSMRLEDFIHSGGEGGQRRKVRISNVKSNLSKQGRYKSKTRLFKVTASLSQNHCYTHTQSSLRSPHSLMAKASNSKSPTTLPTSPSAIPYEVHSGGQI